MRLLNFLSAPLLISMWIAPSVAQTPQDQSPAILPNPFATQPLPGSRIPPMDFHSQMAPNAKDGSTRGLNSRTLKRLNPFVFRPNDLYALQNRLAAAKLAAPGSLLAHNSDRCYAIRDYRFRRVAPDSDATRLSGSSTCEPAGDFRPKTVR
jgi:hypothetical protein